MPTKKHILIIDDDAQIRRLFGGKLAAAGYEVLYSDNGVDGREIARRMLPDLILLDIRMPNQDGYETARLLHNERQTVHIPIVFLTNEDMTLEGEKAVKEMWVEDYIHKSTDLNEFVKRIQNVLKKNTQRKEITEK